jgi:hypothetical protein
MYEICMYICIFFFSSCYYDSIGFNGSCFIFFFFYFLGFQGDDLARPARVLSLYISDNRFASLFRLFDRRQDEEV